MIKKILFCVGIVLSIQSFVNAAATTPKQSRRRAYSKINAAKYSVPEKIVFEAQKDNISGVLMLIKKKGIDATDSNNNTALHLAAGQGLEKVIIFLLAQGANVNAQNKNLDTPLHWAAAKGYYKTLKILRKAGADLTISNKQGNHAYDVAIACDYPIAARYVPHWKDLPRMGEQPIVEFVDPNPEIAQANIEEIASLSATRNVPQTREEELMDAVRRGLYMKTFRIVEYGTPLTGVDQNGNTLLHIAAQEGFHEITRLFIRKKAPVDLQNNDGDTPLHLAALRRHRRIMACLFKAGADPDIKNHAGDTPRDNAQGENCANIFEH
jgi:ankyrin repeat protein